MCVDDVGDKMYVVMQGEITISLPDPEIPPNEFKKRYKEYTNLLADSESFVELERKKKIVATPK